MPEYNLRVVSVGQIIFEVKFFWHAQSAIIKKRILLMHGGTVLHNSVNTVANMAFTSCAERED